MKVDDNTLFPFGRYRGTKICNVPATYLIWAYEEVDHLDKDIKAYIEDNMDLLKEEAKKNVGR